MFCKKGGSFDARGLDRCLKGQLTPARSSRPARPVHVPAVADVLHRPLDLDGRGIGLQLYEARGRRFSLAEYARFLPASIYRSRSFAVDVQLLFFNQLLAPARWLVGALSSRSSRSWARRSW